MSESKLSVIYGPGFPGLEVFGEKDPERLRELGVKWREWVDERFREQQPAMEARNLHAARHRLFRANHQWISTRDGRSWREPQADSNKIRAVLNIIGPALNFRLGVLQEQRPGWKFQPLGVSTEAKEQAQAQQNVVEYYYYAKKAWQVFRDAHRAAQTDGVAFVHVFIDPAATVEHENVELVGPKDDRFLGLLAQGYKWRDDGQIELPLDGMGHAMPPGSKVRRKLRGDLAFRTVYQHETIADPEAKTLNGPHDPAKWFIVRRERDLRSAQLELGDEKLQSEGQPIEASVDFGMAEWQRGLPPYPPKRLQPDKVVYEYLVYLGRSVELPEGAWLRIVGNRVVKAGKRLPGGVIPLARVTDGSDDPDLYPRPVVADWIGDQIAINALLSMILENARVWGPGRLIAQKDTILSESWTTITGSVVQYSGLKPDLLSTPHSYADAWRALQFLVKSLEDKTGWSDIARGQVTGSGSFQDVSGRAILSAREMFERTLGPMVRAAAEAVTEWAELVVVYARELFSEPRTVPVVAGRTDLAKQISREQLGARPLVYCDPETLMPLPRALRNQMLYDMWQQGLISAAEYKQRAPFALIQDVYSGDAQQYSRAQWVNEVLCERWRELDELADQDPLLPFLPEQGVPVLWADDPQVHMTALLELILDDRKPWQLRRLAQERYVIYQELWAAQQGSAGVDANGQPLPPAPVPIEVIGAPDSLPRKNAPAAMRGGAVPGGAAMPAALAAPESAPMLSEATQLTAEPLGALGPVEEVLAGGEKLER